MSDADKDAASDAAENDMSDELARLREEVRSLRDRNAALEKQLAGVEEQALGEMRLREEFEGELKAAQDAMKEMAEQIRLRPLAPNAKTGAPIFFALCEISNSGRPLKPGDPLPFDPYNPPKGFDGFIEGVHFRRG